MHIMQDDEMSQTQTWKLRSISKKYNGYEYNDDLDFMEIWCDTASSQSPLEEARIIYLLEHSFPELEIHTRAEKLLTDM